MFFIKRLLNVVRRIDQSKLFSMSKIEIAKLRFFTSPLCLGISSSGVINQRSHFKKLRPLLRVEIRRIQKHQMFKYVSMYFNVVLLMSYCDLYFLNRFMFDLQNQTLFIETAENFAQFHGREKTIKIKILNIFFASSRWFYKEWYKHIINQLKMFSKRVAQSVSFSWFLGNN